jgi:hypothetical protein
MLSRLSRSLAVAVCALIGAAVVATSWWLPAAHILSGDQNGDGRPDIWRTYDSQGRLAEVAVDTNFDGRADVNEYYERGALIRRESDRDFNDRVDLVQEFDRTTQEQVRSVEDVDFDGTADLLILFRDGQPVFSKTATPIARALAAGVSGLKTATRRRTPSDHLVPLEDPFSTELSVRAVHLLADADYSVGLSTSGGLPASRHDAVSPLPSSSPIPDSRRSHPAAVALVCYSPRGPPAASPIA